MAAAVTPAARSQKGAGKVGEQSGVGPHAACHLAVGGKWVPPADCDHQNWGAVQDGTSGEHLQKWVESQAWKLGPPCCHRVWISWPEVQMGWGPKRRPPLEIHSVIPLGEHHQ